MNDVLMAIRKEKDNIDSLMTGDKLIIYGAGNFGKDVFHAAVRKGLSIIAFLDQNAKPGRHYEGIPVLRPDNSSIPANEKANIPIFLAVHNRDVELFPIISLLKTLGYLNVLTPVVFYDLLGDQLGNRFWLTNRSYYLQYEDAIREGFSVWADDTSRNLYRQVLKYRVTGDYDLPPMPDLKCQYVSTDIPSWKTPLRFVDCGAFDGDTIRKFIELGIHIQAVAAFEPDENNFRALSFFVRERLKALNDITLWPCAVYSATNRKPFFSGVGESAKLSDAGSATVQCVSLDDVIPYFRPNLIKMDIEGAEYDALLGAKQTIVENIPGLAICVYHQPDDLWRIPLLVQRWGCEYEFYLRQHAYNGFDLVMYGVKGQPDN